MLSSAEGSMNWNGWENFKWLSERLSSRCEYTFYSSKLCQLSDTESKHCFRCNPDVQKIELWFILTVVHWFVNWSWCHVPICDRTIITEHSIIQWKKVSVGVDSSNCVLTNEFLTLQRLQPCQFCRFQQLFSSAPTRRKRINSILCVLPASGHHMARLTHFCETFVWIMSFRGISIASSAR